MEILLLFVGILIYLSIDTKEEKKSLNTSLNTEVQQSYCDVQ